MDIDKPTGKMVEELSPRTSESVSTGGRLADVELLMTVAWFPSFTRTW